MQEFIAKHQDKITGTLSGFDRLVFRGHLRSIGYPRGMMTYLWFNQVLLKNFGNHVAEVTERLKEASLAEAKAYGRPVKYLNSGQNDKETIARDILAQDGVRVGLVCVLSCLEPCWKFEIHRSRQTKKLELQLRTGKCRSSTTTRSILSSAFSMPASKLGSRSPFRSASTDGNGWRDRCKPPVWSTCSMITASLTLPTGPKLSA
jgi:hypothetical protein